MTSDTSHQENEEKPENQSGPSLYQQANLQGEVVALTGTLAAMTHQEASALIEQHGGEFVSHISKRTSMLVIGEEGWPLESDGQPSVKLIQAVKQKQSGQQLRIIKESEFLQLLELNRPQETVSLYTPASLSQMINVPVHLIRTWTLWGLLVPHHTVNRLPYFTAQELHRAKSLARLTAEGLTREQLCHYVAQVRSLLIEAGQGDRELHYLGHALVIRDQKGYQDVMTHQRFFNFEPETESADESGKYTLPMLRVVSPEDPAEHKIVDWFVEGCRLADADRLEEAIPVFRKSLLQFSRDAECHFYLADVLYRTGRIQAAFEQYHMAVELDPKYLEAWVQLACLYAMDQHWDDAEQSLQKCLEIDPDFPDAHYHLAEILHEQQRTPEALPHWEFYLQSGVRGPWADLARQRLEDYSDDQAFICTMP